MIDGLCLFGELSKVGFKVLPYEYCRLIRVTAVDIDTLGYDILRHSFHSSVRL